MENKVIQQDVYQRQQDTLIVWTELDGTDLALSFQLADGANDVWEAVCEAQKQISAIKVDFPPIRFPLDEVEEWISEMIRHQKGRDMIVERVLSGELIEELGVLFLQAEKEGKNDEICKIYNIFRIIVYINNSKLFEYLINHLEEFIGVFEYDPEYPIPRNYYREYLKKDRFIKIIEINDEKIRFIFKALFLKDVVLARILEESTFSCLQQIIMYAQLDLLNSINDENVKNIIEKMQNNDIYAMRFLHELVTSARSVQLFRREILFKQILACGFFEFILASLRAQVADKSLQLALEVLEIIAESEAGVLLRDKSPLLELLVEFGFRENNDFLYLIFSIIRLLIEGNISIFDKIFNHLNITTNLLYIQLSVELIECAIKQLKIQELLIIACNLLLKSQFIQLEGIKLTRMIVELKNEQADEQIVKSGILMRLFEIKSERDNLLNSAILNIFEIIISQERKILVEYLNMNCQESIQRVEICRSLFQPLNCSMDISTTSAPTTPKMKTKLRNVQLSVTSAVGAGDGEEQQQPRSVKKLRL